MSYTPPPPPPEQGGDPSQSTPPGYGAPPPPGGGYGGPPPPGGNGGGDFSGGGYGAPPGYGPSRNSGKAVVALVIGILSPVLGLCCAFFGLVGIAAILVGRSAKTEIEQSVGRLTGAGMAQAGVVLGIIGCVIGLVMTVVNLLLIQNGVTTFNLESS